MSSHSKFKFMASSEAMHVSNTLLLRGQGFIKKQAGFPVSQGTE